MSRAAVFNLICFLLMLVALAVLWDNGPFWVALAASGATMWGVHTVESIRER